jgi:DNA helicase-2/ATP-dependent DNA helicase PcrA
MPPRRVVARGESLSHPIVEEELALLARVNELLDGRIEPAGPDERPILRDLERLREQLVSRRETKDEFALTEQWNRQTALLRQLRASRDAPVVDPGSPYFAHLRLSENGDERDLCIGRATCIERGVRIVDWRNAPISRIFYRYPQDDEYEEEFGGSVHVGKVLARRTLRIRDAVLDHIEAPEGVFLDSDGGWHRVERERSRLAGGEATALRAHGAGEGLARRLGTDLEGDRRRADKRLPEITGLIDPAQFDLITRPSTGFLVVRGSAGSGKTTVALHRIAYLAFDDAEVDSDRTIFVVFSPALRSYVSHVLPALGVEGVRITTFREWALEQRRRHFPDLPTEVREDSPAAVQRLKLHPVLAEALARHVASTPGPRNREQALDDWLSVMTRLPLLRTCCEELAPGLFPEADLRQFVEWSRRRNEELAAWLAGDGESEASLDPEDDALLLRAWQLRVGPLRYRRKRPLRYRHVAIDEVQDFAPLEVNVLLECLDARRSITLAGDTQQHVMQQSGFTSWSEFLSHLGVPGTSIDTLRVSYRSTREIMDFALSVLGDLREEDEVPEAPRSGPAVELFRFTDRGACVAFLSDALRELAREEPLASVAVLTPDAAASAVYYEGLVRGDLDNLRRVENQDFTFAPGIEVTEIAQVKGLEFDYVILVDATPEHFPDADAARRLLHVGASRAVHQLWLTCVGTPSPLVGDLER